MKGKNNFVENLTKSEKEILSEYFKINDFVASIFGIPSQKYSKKELKKMAMQLKEKESKNA